MLQVEDFIHIYLLIQRILNKEKLESLFTLFKIITTLHKNNYVGSSSCLQGKKNDEAFMKRTPNIVII